MSKKIKTFVEGEADRHFLLQYIRHIKPNYEIKEEDINVCRGWIIDEDLRGRMKRNTDDDGINLIIFDADDSFQNRKNEIIAKYEAYEYQLFLFPDNAKNGALEDLLEAIIPDENKPILCCFERYEQCLRGQNFAVPAKKAKIYAYLEALLGTTETEKKKIKEEHREYSNKQHWNLDSNCLEPLKKFLNDNIL